MKEVNVAYEKVEAFLSSKQGLDSEQRESAQAEAQARPQASADARAKAKEDYYERADAESETRHKTEAAVETATGIILGACFYLYNSLRRFVYGQVQKAKTEIETNAEQREPKVREWQSRGNVRVKGKGMGRGGGRGMGKGRGRP